MIEAGLLFYDNRKTIDIEDMRVVLRGLVLAVLAYMSYAIGLTILNGFHPQDLIVAIILWAIYIWSMRTILPGVENEMRIPVLIYG